MNQQKVLAEFEALNRFAHTDGIVLLGSTSAAHLPLNELTQDFNLDSHVYNRSVENLRINEAERTIYKTIRQLAPEKLLLNLGETELAEGKQSVETLMEQYQWLLYQVHTMMPKTRIILVSVDSRIAGAARFNQALYALCRECGCEYADSPAKIQDMDYNICFFHTIKPFFYHRTMSLSDALHCCAG